MGPKTKGTKDKIYDDNQGKRRRRGHLYEGEPTRCWSPCFYFWVSKEKPYFDNFAGIQKSLSQVLAFHNRATIPAV